MMNIATEAKMFSTIGPKSMTELEERDVLILANLLAFYQHV